MIIFNDRESAGELLSEKLENYSNLQDTIILAIPRGGVVVGREISKKLNLPLDVVITRKIRDPLQPELALGAIDPAGAVYWDQPLLDELNIKKEDLKVEVISQTQEIKRRERLYRKSKPTLKLKDQTLILVDDGIATGATIISAIKYLENQGAKKILLAVPVVAEEVAQKVFEEVDEMVVLYKADYLGSVGKYYQNFNEVSDELVINLLNS